MNKEKNLVGRKNNPGMAFNPLTLQYDNSVQGEILKKRDDESKFRALMRATNIDKHANAGYNIINGEERTIMENRMLKEIEPSVYKKNINKINELNQRHNDNDNFYTKGPYTQPKIQYQSPQEQNDFNNDNYNNINEGNNEYNNNIPPNPKDINNNINNDNKQMMQNEMPQNIPVNMNDKEYQRMTPKSMPPNENYKNNYDNNYQDRREYNKTPSYYENNWRKMTPSNRGGYNQPPQQNEDFQQKPDHYSEQDKRYQNMRHDFDRQYNYIDNNYEQYNNQNQEYNNERPVNSPNSANYQREGDYNNYNRNRDPYARPDFYANNKSRPMG